MSEKRKERGICELYAEDAERADALLFGRQVDQSRRGFLRGAGLAAMAGAVGASIPFAEHMPAGLIPAAFAENTQPFTLEGKKTVALERMSNFEPCLTAFAIPSGMHTK